MNCPYIVAIPRLKFRTKGSSRLPGIAIQSPNANQGAARKAIKISGLLLLTKMNKSCKVIPAMPPCHDFTLFYISLDPMVNPL